MTIRLQNTLTLLLGALCLGFVAYKAFTLSLTHDEVATMVHYRLFTPWQIMMFPDPWPNNHILNTLLAKGCMALFGVEPWAARLPNVPAFALYFWAAWRIAWFLFGNRLLLFFSCVAAFVLNPFLLDFFSLCRGYGLSNALLLWSVLQFMLAYRDDDKRALWFGWAFATLASYANFTLLIFWSAANGVWLLYWMVRRYQRETTWRPLLAWLGANFAYLLLIAEPIYDMQSTNQFVFWDSKGFFKSTVVSLVECTRFSSVVFHIPNEAWALAAVLFFFACGAYLMYLWGAYSGDFLMKQALTVTFTLLALTVLVNVLQTVFLQTPNLTTRTALSFYPLFVAMAYSALQQWWRTLPKQVEWAAGIVLVMVVWHISRTLRFTDVREWWYDADNVAVLRKINELKSPGADSVSLATHWLFNPSMGYYVQYGKAGPVVLEPYNKEIDTTTRAEFYYIPDSELPILREKFDIVQRYGSDSRLLMRRKTNTQ